MQKMIAKSVLFMMMLAISTQALAVDEHALHLEGKIAATSSVLESADLNQGKLAATSADAELALRTLIEKKANRLSELTLVIGYHGLGLSGENSTLSGLSQTETVAFNILADSSADLNTLRAVELELEQGIRNAEAVLKENGLL